jgi:hypothetical protein
VIRLYPDKVVSICAQSSEDSGPKLTDWDAYGERVDTGERVNGLSISRYVKNGVHICETAPGSHVSFRWAEVDPDA